LETFVVIDFETTGLSPNQGARPTEVAAVMVCNGKIHDHYQSLMKTGAPIPAFIESLTGISNAMVRAAPPIGTVMRQVAEFAGSLPLVAHNASFDSQFWDAELKHLKIERKQDFICSLLLARRIFPEAPSHKLGELAQHLGLPGAKRYHRALADAEVTAHLMLDIKSKLKQSYQLQRISHELLLSIQSVSRKKIASCIERARSNECTNISKPSAVSV
jgi:DNA polymerase-3 subunit epsilon